MQIQAKVLQSLTKYPKLRTINIPKLSNKEWNTAKLPRRSAWTVSAIWTLMVGAIALEQTMVMNLPTNSAGIFGLSAIVTNPMMPVVTKMRKDFRRPMALDKRPPRGEVQMAVAMYMAAIGRQNNCNFCLYWLLLNLYWFFTTVTVLGLLNNRVLKKLATAIIISSELWFHQIEKNDP